MDLSHGPPGREIFHRDRRSGFDLIGAVARLAQFVGQRHRKAASMGSRNQFGRVRASSLSTLSNVEAGHARGILQDIAVGSDGPFAVLVTA